MYASDIEGGRRAMPPTLQMSLRAMPSDSAGGQTGSVPCARINLDAASRAAPFLVPSSCPACQ
eukprot:2270209-Rhodomonas_salina.1